MVSDGYWKYREDHFAEYMVVKPLCRMSETNTE